MEEPLPITKTFFLTPKTGLGLSGNGDDTFLARTADGGMTWTRLAQLPSLTPDRKLTIRALRFLDTQNGWIIGDQSGGLSYVLQTQDGGASVNLLGELSDRYGLSRSIFVEPSRRIWLLGNDSIQHSADGGHTWRTQLSRSDLPGNVRDLVLEDMWVDGRGFGFAVGEVGEGVILKTQNFGGHWEIAFRAPDATGFMSISRPIDGQSCAVGYSTSLYCMLDGNDLGEARDAAWGSRGRGPSLH